MKKMCRKVVSLLLAAVMVLTMTAFASVVYALTRTALKLIRTSRWELFL